MKTAPAIIIALLIVAGCRMEQQPAVELAPDTALVAAKVAAVMQANDITPLDVVTWLAARGQTVDTESAWWHPHWRAASGTVDYYGFEMKGAVRDTAAAIRVRDAIGAVEMKVRGVDVLPDGTVVVGPWSDAGRSAGELLPGVAE